MGRAFLWPVPPNMHNNYRKPARLAIQNYFMSHSQDNTIPLFTLSIIADKAAAVAGKKGELFRELSSYEILLPIGAKMVWVNGIYSVVNPYCTEPAPKGDQAPMPGFFDAAVDMGPDIWSARLKEAK